MSATKFGCPACHTVLQLRTAPPPGAKARCPKCSTVFQLGVAAAPRAAAVPARAAAVAAPRTAGPGARRVAAGPGSGRIAAGPGSGRMSRAAQAVDDDEDDDYEEEERRPRKPRKKRKSGTGANVGMVVGVILGVAVLVVGVVFAVLYFPTGGGRKSNDFNVNSPEEVLKRIQRGELQKPDGADSGSGSRSGSNAPSKKDNRSDEKPRGKANDNDRPARDDDGGGGGGGEGLEVGMLAPEISGVDADGKRFKLSDFRGKVVMLDFWGHWCPHCINMLPHEREMVSKFQGKPFEILGINTDRSNNPADMKARDKKAGVPFRSWLDGSPRGKISSSYKVQAFPTLFILDHKGVIRYKFEGAPAPHVLDQAVEELLNQVSSSS